MISLKGADKHFSSDRRVTMVRKFILTLAAATAVGAAFIPAVASADDIRRDFQDIRRDRQDLRHDERQLGRDIVTGHFGAARRDLADINRDRRDLHHDERDLGRDLSRRY
jgi:hypothetical protein